VQFDDAERGALSRTTEQIINRNWRAVSLIGRALYRAGQLDRRQIIALLRGERRLARRARKAVA
jgi:hypothetical protein